MCEYVPGELLFSFHRDDPAARALLEDILAGQVSHVTVLERLEDRFQKLDLRARPDGTFRFVKLGVPVGDETFKIGYLQFFYKHALMAELVAGRLNPNTNDVHARILGSSNFHPQFAHNAMLSVAAATASGVPGTAFTSNNTHTAYKHAFGWPGSTSNGAGITMLVMDTGVDSVSAYNVVDGRNFLDDTQTLDVSDEHGHGTAIVSVLNDVAPGADIIVYKVADKHGIASEWALLAGLAAQSGAQVVNLSLAFGLGDLQCQQCGRASHSTRSALFENMIDDLTSLPDAPVIVGAAGNVGKSELSFPARYNDVVAVASTDGALQLSLFSNRSTFNQNGQPHPSVFVLPGGRSVVQGVPSEYIGISANRSLHWGTSIAAAYASGIVARAWSDPQRRQWTRQQVLTHLRANADTSMPSYTAATYGNGLMKCL